MSDLPVVSIFGAEGLSLLSKEGLPFETRDMDCRCYPDDKKLAEVMAKDRPTVLVSVGRQEDFPALSRLTGEAKKSWLHFNDLSNRYEVGNRAFDRFLEMAMGGREGWKVSVFTPTYKTGNRIRRPYGSLLGQTFQDWEWVVMDDSDDDGATFRELSALAEREPRMRVYKESKHSGRIGTVKRSACGLCRGDVLVELDHDDELTPDALEWIVKAFERFPEAGFVYTDCSEAYESGAPVTYGPGWGMGYGSYREEVHGGIKYQVINAPNVNPKTIRHIVAAPNHIRAWRRSFYESVGGHADLLHVADDYELMVRTFLRTRMVHVPKMCYVQYRNDQGNTSLGVRNRDIQRLVRYISMGYDRDIHNRFLKLGVDDFVWKDGEPTFYRLQTVPNPQKEQHCTLTMPIDP